MKVVGASWRVFALLLLCLILSFSSGAYTQAQQLDESSVVQHIDAVIKARFEDVLGFTVTEHYSVFRNNDETHSAAEMTVKTTYSKDTGKSYAIISQSGSSIVRRFVLDALLENEKRINQPGNREASWFTSANYTMKLPPGAVQSIDGRECLTVSIKPKQTAPNLIEGTMWVDAKDYSTVEIRGTASRSPSLLTGPAQVMRQYANVNGFAEATHARAVSNSFLFGQTIVTIDYRDYQMQVRSNN